MENNNQKTERVSVSTAIIIAGLLISISIFLTTWIFFGGQQNRSRLFFKFPTAPTRINPSTVTPPAQNVQRPAATTSAKIVPPVKATATTTIKR